MRLVQFPEPERLGEFRLYPPIPNTSKTGWTLSWSEVWMSGSYADRNAVVLIAGLALGAPLSEGVELMNRLQERVNQGEGRDITVQDILAGWHPDYQ